MSALLPSVRSDQLPLCESFEHLADRRRRQPGRLGHVRCRHHRARPPGHLAQHHHGIVVHLAQSQHVRSVAPKPYHSRTVSNWRRTAWLSRRVLGGSRVRRVAAYEAEDTEMRIVDVVEKSVPIRSEIRNAFIDFSQMTCSVVALVTDVVRDGRPVVGYGFNSNGRYAQGGLLRERFLPRLKAAEAKALVNEASDNLDPEKIWAVLMANEKPGGHGDRSDRKSTRLTSSN